jgi:hypothetical protein
MRDLWVFADEAVAEVVAEAAVNAGVEKASRMLTE